MAVDEYQALQPNLIKRLALYRDHLIDRLSEVNHALAILEATPSEVQKVIDVVSKLNL